MKFLCPLYLIEVRTLSLNKSSKEIGPKLDLDTVFHPQTNRQSERTIQVIEDMLRVCMAEFGGCLVWFLLVCKFCTITVLAIVLT